ncbi:oligopeptide transport system ATP-binding protein [Mycobacterium frederiksbergense]|uniref:Oligopeptide transport system ATP-binding protein n=1 Tax=Mycolicibacterium frederiksbergense TaxID=117567 RepID=A0ABT6L6K3_9MYCO|nr:ABC transporter ATP-binding protein [Mycolicibacterium frederiksbergense]MDH6198576.1 oligopeptide transport system ATP-binding protein [Mycolicibacterium frederiksbergense]
MTLLRIDHLNVSLPVAGTYQPVLVDVNLTLAEGQILGVAGESGSGKTMTGLSVLRLLPSGARHTGSITLNGRELLELSPRRMREVRGRDVAMVFQDPMSSLHPMLTVGRQLTDHLIKHRKVSRAVAKARAVELLEQVRLPSPERTLKAYPHQLSGGMRQRVAIAIALACEPKVLIADEPTTALDVTVQAGILQLLDTLRSETGVGIMVITHDLGVLSSVADDLAVFYAGRIIEQAPAAEVFRRPTHPYTSALLAALPHVEDANGEFGLRPLRGAPPGIGEWPEGCVFAPRCERAVQECQTRIPDLDNVADGHSVACFVAERGSEIAEQVVS